MELKLRVRCNLENHAEFRIQYVRHHNIILDLFTFLINLTGLIVHDASMQMYNSYITLSTSEITFLLMYQRSHSLAK